MLHGHVAGRRGGEEHHLLPFVRGVKSGSTRGPSPFSSTSLMPGACTGGAEAASSCSFCLLFSRIFTVSCLWSLVALTRVCKASGITCRRLPEGLDQPVIGLSLHKCAMPLGKAVPA